MEVGEYGIYEDRGFRFSLHGYLSMQALFVFTALAYVQHVEKAAPPSLCCFIAFEKDGARHGFMDMHGFMGMYLLRGGAAHNLVQANAGGSTLALQGTQAGAAARDVELLFGCPKRGAPESIRDGG